MKDDITDVPGVRVGHAEDKEALTGCTVILFENGAVGGADIRGTASSTRQADSLDPLHVVDRIHAIFLTGGSAYGLDAASGVMRYLEERDVGFPTAYGRIPSVPTAAIFDLSLGNPKVRPNPDMAYDACLSAGAGPVAQGCVGAGTGASVGKYHGIARAMKGGLAGASEKGAGDVVVGALAVVNAFGDVIDPESGKVLAGLRDAPDGRRLIRTAGEMRKGIPREIAGFQNTTLVVVATNVGMSKVQAAKMAQAAQVGLARTVSPVHSPTDGDVVFGVSTGEAEGDLLQVLALAELAAMRAIVKAVVSAEPMGGIPAWKQLHSGQNERLSVQCLPS